MKKLMIMLAAIAVGSTVNAAAYSWSASSGRLFDGQGNASANRYAGTGYLFNAETVSQTDILAAFANDMIDSKLTLALSDGTFSAGRASVSSEFDGPNANFTAYFVVFGKDGNGNDAIYISDTTMGEYAAVGQGAVEFGQQNAYSSVGFKEASAGYSSAGWYSQSVPEPTSGLLMLLGMAGLALRRRRA